MLCFPLSWRKAQKQVHFQQQHCIMKKTTSRSALPTSTLHHKGRLSCARFPYSTSTSALTRTTLHYEGNLMHVIFPSIVKESKRTIPLETTNCHHEEKHKCIVKNTIAL
jgi:hypothetical protein